MKQELIFPKIPLVIFDTEKRIKVKFEPHDPNHVLMYTCGPTVYNYAHIGNFRTYVFEDLLRRTLKFFGFQVTQAMNLTDIDDKTIRGAIEKKCSLEEYTLPFKRAFFADISTLGIERVEAYPEATKYIGHMIDMIQKLMDKGYAYKSNDNSIYFSIEKWEKYGRLAHLKFDELKTTIAPSDADEYDKESAADFVLWKSYHAERDGIVVWQSPFGPGRPGWHLECSTMAMEILGHTIDLHVGAVDNIFPHHENEIAQSEACSGHLFVRHWMHSEHLIVNGKKMSKSAHNFYTLQDLLDKGYSGKEVRYMLMHIHYRTLLNFTFESMSAAKRSLERINDFVLRMNEIASTSQNFTQEVKESCQKAINLFSASLADDLNISEALAAIFGLIHEMNAIADANQLTAQDAKEVLFVLEEMNRVLNVMNFEEEEVPKEMQELLTKREEARKQKNWKESDALRDKIIASGYRIEDTAKGPRLKKQR